MAKSIRKEFRMIFTFAVTVLITVLLLKLLNWIPSAFQDNDIRKYRNVDEVVTKLQVPKVYVPAYFPEHIKWPPSEIFAQKKPYAMIIMHFMHRDEQSFALSVYQIDSKSRYEPRYKTDVLYTKKESTVYLKGRKATLLLAVCRGNERCNRLTWEEGKFRITLISDDEPEEILRMAESML